MAMSTSKQIWIAALTAALMMPVAASAASAGRITQAVPDAQLIKPTGTVPAKEGTLLDSGDEVSTGAGRVQFVLSDRSKFALPAGSNFKVDEYAERTATTPGKALYSFIKGAFRTVSGLVGKGKDDTYLVQTPIATMGIRGTDYAAVLKKEGQSNDGLYVMVFAGTVWVKNKAGTRDISAGQIVYIKDEDTMPELAPNARSIFVNAGINPDANINFTLTPSVQLQGPDGGTPRLPVIRTPTVPPPENPASPS